jgi:hypothetical protein
VEEKLLTAGEVAARWSVHKATVLRLYHEGALPGVLLSQTAKRALIRFRIKAIEDWEKKQEIGAAKVVGD